MFLYEIDLEWKNISLESRLIDISFGLNKIENDLWLHLVQLKCQSNVIQQICANQRNHLITLNDQLQRRVNFIKYLILLFFSSLNKSKYSFFRKN